MFTPLELICCGLAEEEAIAQIGEESVEEEEVYHQNLILKGNIIYKISK